MGQERALCWVQSGCDEPGSLRGLGCLLAFLSGGDAGEVAKGRGHFTASAG